MANYDLERAFLLQMLAADGVDETTPLHDLRTLYYAKAVGSRVIPVFEGQSVQAAVDAAEAAIPYVDSVVTELLTFGEDMPADGDLITLAVTNLDGTETEIVIEFAADFRELTDPSYSGFYFDSAAATVTELLGTGFLSLSEAHGAYFASSSVDGLVVTLTAVEAVMTSVEVSSDVTDLVATATTDSIHDPATPFGEVQVHQGTYEESVTTTYDGIIRCFGEVTIDGDVTFGGQNDLLNATVTGTVTGATAAWGEAGIKNWSSRARNQVTSYQSGSDTIDLLSVGPIGEQKQMGDWLPEYGTSFDRPLPRPRFTDRKALIVLVLDDANATYAPDAATFSELGDVNPYNYLLSKAIPVTWPVIPAQVAAGTSMSYAQIKAVVKALGGSVANHSYTHSALTAENPALSVIQDEFLDAITEIEAQTGFPCRTYFHFGGSTFPGSTRATTLSNAIVRAKTVGFRLGANSTVDVMPVGDDRYNALWFRSLDNLKATAGSVAAAQARMTHMFNVVAASQGLVLGLYSHGVIADASSANTGLCVSVFKTLVDTLATLRDAGTIDIVPFAQACYTYPTYRPNWFCNGGFEVDPTIDIADSATWPHQAALTGSSALTWEADPRTGSAGAKSLKITRAADGTAKFRQTVTKWLAGEQYTIDYWYKSDVAHQLLLAPAVGGVYLVQDDAVPSSSGSWVRRVRNFTVPVGYDATGGMIQWTVNATGYVSLDDVEIG